VDFTHITNLMKHSIQVRQLATRAEATDILLSAITVCGQERRMRMGSPDQFCTDRMYTLIGYGFY